MPNKYIFLISCFVALSIVLLFLPSHTETEKTVIESEQFIAPELPDKKLLPDSMPVRSDKRVMKKTEHTKKSEMKELEIIPGDGLTSFENNIGLEIKDGSKVFNVSDLPIWSREELEQHLDELASLANNDPVIMRTKLAYENHIVTISAQQDNNFNLRRVECTKHVCLAQLDLNDENKLEEIKSSFFRSQEFQNGIAGFSSLTRYATQQKEQLTFYFTTNSDLN